MNAREEQLTDNLTSMVDLEKLQPIANRIIDEVFTQGSLASVAEHDRIFFVLWSYPAMVENGGFPAFFYNSPADHYSDTLDALRNLSLPDHAELLERAAAMLFESDVPATTEARNAVIDQLPEGVGTDEEFDELLAEYMDRGGGDRILEVLQEWYFAGRT